MNIDLREQLKQKKQAYVQDEIISAAAILFAEKGFRAITINDVAASLGYTKSVVYYYFKSKNELLWQIFMRMHEKYQATLSDIIAKDLPPVATLREIIYQHALHVMKWREWSTIYFRDESELLPEQRVLTTKRKREYDNIIEAVYEKGVASGDFKDIPVHIAVSGFMGMCNWLHTWFNDQGKLSAEDIAEYYCDLLAGGYLKS